MNLRFKEEVFVNLHVYSFSSTIHLYLKPTQTTLLIGHFWPMAAIIVFCHTNEDDRILETLLSILMKVKLGLFPFLIFLD